MSRPALRKKSLRAESGATTLVMVMVMFLILALMAAYANRNLVFEQRIASNYVRAGVAAELAEAGVEWTLAQLNGPNIGAACVGGAGNSSFRGRYLNQDPGTRTITPLAISNTKMAVSCVRNTGSSWACQCPAPGQWADAASPASTTPQPSFGVQFQTIARPGVLRLVSVGCTGNAISACNNPMSAAASDPLIGSAFVRTEVALLSALPLPPAAPLVLRGGLIADDLGLHNTDLRSGGTLMNSGDKVPTLSNERLDSLPGTPPAQALIGNDPNLLAAVAPDAMFRLFFGMPYGKYSHQPAMRRIDCSGDCSSQLLDAYNSGVRMIWVAGPLTLSNLSLGSSASPLLILAEGDVTMSGSINLTGLLYARGDVRWSSLGAPPAALNGALISEGSVTITGHVDLWYQGGVMDLLSNATGSFVRVPDSWTDG